MRAARGLPTRCPTGARSSTPACRVSRGGADTGRQARRGLQRESSRWGNEKRNFNGMRKRYEQGRRAGLEAEAGRWPSGTDCA